MILIFQIIVIILLIAAGALLSGSETGVYRLSRFRLRLGIEQKQPLFTMLGRLMDDSHGLVFSLLIGNNLTHCLITWMVTLMFIAGHVSDRAAQLYATILVAPVLFIFSEVIPKNVYYYRSDILMPRFAGLLWFFHKLFTWSGAVALLKLLSRALTRLAGLTGNTPVTITTAGAGYIKQIINQSRDEGILSPMQNDIMNRLVNITNITVGSVMTVIADVQMVDVNTDRQALLAKLQQTPYTHLPVYQHSRDNIIGFINIYEPLCLDRRFLDLSDFVKPIGRLGTITPVIDAINRMRSGNYDIALVVRGPGGIGAAGQKNLGIITTKDLIEELTGEL